MEGRRNCGEGEARGVNKWKGKERKGKIMKRKRKHRR